MKNYIRKDAPTHARLIQIHTNPQAETQRCLKGKPIALPPPRVSRDSRLSHTRTIRKDLRGELVCDYTYS